jgi:DNA-binding NarL/FixJ family response regulator
MRILFVCTDETVTAAATKILAESGVELTIAENLEAADLRHVDAVLLWHQELRRMSRTRRSQFLHLPTRIPVIVAMRIENAAAMAEDTSFADGIVFVDANLGRLVEIVRLTQAGYMLLPKDLTPDRLDNSAQIVEEADLGGLDLEVLAALGEGMTDRQISQRMHVSEPTAKRLVHRLMRRLSVENRTRAAVYTRVLARIREALRNRG